MLAHQAASAASITVMNYSGSSLLLFDPNTGDLLDSIGNVPSVRSELNRGPDGSLYVTLGSYSDDYKILRIDPDTGATSHFVDGSGYGGIRGMDFGPNGNLFVAAQGGSIVEFDGQAGTFIRNFITGIQTPIDLAFAPDGTLYVARGHHQISSPSSILRYDGLSGTFLSTFAQTQVDTPQNILVGPDGDVYVTNQWDSAEPLVRFDGMTGEVKFAVSGGLSNPQGLTFGPDGNLLVASADNTIKRFDPNTGEFLGNFLEGYPISFPIGLVYVPEPSSLALAGMAVNGGFLMRRRWRRR